MVFGRIGVLMGGPSAERPISFQSGTAVCEALRSRGHDVAAVEIPQDVTGVEALLAAARLDVAFIALHGTFGEDGAIQAILERLGILYTGSGILASRCGMNKQAARQRFAAEGITTPPVVVLSPTHRRHGTPAERIAAKFPYPVVVKPCSQGSSVGMSLVARAADLDAAVEAAAAYDETVLVEAHIRGREMTVGILEEEALPVIEVVPSHAYFDYEAKYQPGLTAYHVPAALPEVVARRCQEAALRAHRAIQARHVSRVDLILDAHEAPVVLEINTIPGFTAMSLLPKAARVAGIEFPMLCECIIAAALRDVSTVRAGGRA